MVIHPKDDSTEFLTPIYESIYNKTVIRGGLTYEEVLNQIKDHDRIIMVGHGTPFGLMSVGQFDSYNGHIITPHTAEFLTGKDCIAIWCNADKYMEIHENVKGFYSGMFISEVGEASYMGLQGKTQDEVDASNDTFAEIVGKYINQTTDIVHELTVTDYSKLAETNEIAKYNVDRLYYRN